MSQLSAAGALAGALVLAGCAGSPGALAHGAGVPGADASYDCGDLGRLFVRFDWNRASVDYDRTKQVILKARKTDKGFSYEGEGFELRGDSRGVVWTQGFSDPRLCRPY